MKIIILKLARNDLKEINDYLSEFGEDVPRKFRNSFEKFVGEISKMPFMFSEYENDSNYHQAVLIFEYLAFYRVDENKQEVKIYRVLHGKRNIDKIFHK